MCEIPKEETLLTFPCNFPLKIMGKKTDAFEKTVIDIVLNHAPDFKQETLECRPSKAGNYLSLTCTIQAQSKAQLDDLYRALSGHPAVAMVL